MITTHLSFIYLFVNQCITENLRYKYMHRFVVSCVMSGKLYPVHGVNKFRNLGDLINQNTVYTMELNGIKLMNSTLQDEDLVIGVFFSS